VYRTFTIVCYGYSKKRYSSKIYSYRQSSCLVRQH